MIIAISVIGNKKNARHYKNIDNYLQAMKIIKDDCPGFDSDIDLQEGTILIAKCLERKKLE